MNNDHIVTVQYSTVQYTILTTNIRAINHELENEKKRKRKTNRSPDEARKQ
jgi:hypothetical protein